MKDLEVDHSGESGAQGLSNHSVPGSIVSLPKVPAVRQKVLFYTARNTFIAERIADSSVETMPAIKFDAFISSLFGSIPDIDREAWILADRIYALNAALSQQQVRIKDQQIYIRLDLLPGGDLLISAINPQESAIKIEEETTPDSAA